MLVFDLLLILAGLCGLVAVVLWVRVAASRSLNEAFKLDGTEKLAERSNRSAFRAAAITTLLTLLLGVAAYLAGSGSF